MRAERREAAWGQGQHLHHIDLIAMDVLSWCHDLAIVWSVAHNELIIVRQRAHKQIDGQENNSKLDQLERKKKANSPGCAVCSVIG